MTGGKPFCIYFFLDNISRIILHSSFSLSRSELCISHLSQPEMDLISVVDKRQKTRGLLNSKVCVGGGSVTCSGGHNGRSESIDSRGRSGQGPGVEAPHGRDVGGGRGGGHTGQLESRLAAHQTGG